MSLLAYLLKVILVSAIFFGYYRLFLRNKRFHHYNRFFLLGALLFAVVLPFIRIPLLYNPEDPLNDAVYRTVSVINTDYADDMASTAVAEPAVEPVFTVMNVLFLLYFTGVLALLTLVAKSLLYVRSLRKRYRAERIANLRFYNTHEPGTPFSFFRSVFWNEQLSFNSHDGQQIFRHELFHVQHRHSADRLLAEILTAIFWFNPFFHLIKKELKAIHEFLADQFAVSGSDRYAYATLLVQQALELRKHAVTNHFFQNHIKRRIAMITQFKQSRYGYWSRVMILPVSILLLCFITLYAEKPARGAEVKKDKIAGPAPAWNNAAIPEQARDTVPVKDEKQQAEQKMRQGQLEEVKKKMVEQEQLMRKSQQMQLEQIKKKMQEQEQLAQEQELSMQKRRMELRLLQENMKDRQKRMMQEHQNQLELIKKLEQEYELRKNENQNQGQNEGQVLEDKKRLDALKQDLQQRQEMQMEKMKEMMREMELEARRVEVEQEARQAQLQELRSRIMERQKDLDKEQQLQYEKMKMEYRKHEEDFKKQDTLPARRVSKQGQQRKILKAQKPGQHKAVAIKRQKAVRKQTAAKKRVTTTNKGEKNHKIPEDIKRKPARVDN